MNIFMVKNIALLVVGVKVIHGFWGNTSLHELSQCSSNYIFAVATSPQFFDVTSLSLYHIGSFTSIRCLDSLYSEEISI